MILGQNQKKQSKNNRRWDTFSVSRCSDKTWSEVLICIYSTESQWVVFFTFAKMKLVVNSVFLFLYVWYNSQYAFPIGGKAAPLEAQEESSISLADFPRQLSIHI